MQVYAYNPGNMIDPENPLFGIATEANFLVILNADSCVQDEWWIVSLSCVASLLAIILIVYAIVKLKRRCGRGPNVDPYTINTSSPKPSEVWEKESRR